MRPALGLGVVVLSLGVLSAPFAWSASEDPAAVLIQQAARTKNPDEALALLQQAMKLAPDRPDAHMRYASVLLAKGQAVLAAGKKEDGRAILREVEKELLATLRLAKHEADAIQRTRVKSQANFLLGDLNFYAFGNKERAKGYYQESLWYDPQHPGALEARTRYGESLEYRERAPQSSDTPQASSDRAGTIQ